MSILDLIFTALGLSMDAFAAAACKGVSIKRVDFSKMLTVGVWFGLFQALMPVLGYLLGDLLSDKIGFIDHWISFVLLSAIGIGMIKESIGGNDAKSNASLSPAAILPLAIATSLDAMAVGVAFGIRPDASLSLSAAIIGTVTLIISALGLKLGSLFGIKYKTAAELSGGLILILIGLKILVKDLFF